MTPSPAAPARPLAMPPLPITFTVDVEDHHGGKAAHSRCVAMTRRLMDVLEQRGGRGTFFIDCAILEGARELPAEIARRGHEVACHGYRHVPLEQESPLHLATQLANARQRLEDLASAPVVGFRAPFFSLTAEAGWAVDAIERAGFAYSSSVVPGRGIPFGYPSAPRRPFLWPNGLLEIPCPVAPLGPFSVPPLGGMFLRYLPPWLLRRMMGQLGGQALWAYCHPYDIDVDEPFSRLPGIGLTSSFFLWFNRGNALTRLEQIAANPVPSLSNRLDTLRRGAPLFRGAMRPIAESSTGRLDRGPMRIDPVS